MRKWAVVVGCAVVASIALWLTFFRASGDERIRKTLGELTRVLAVKEGDTLLSRVARVRSGMKEIVDDDVRVNVAELNIDVRGRHRFEEEAAKAGLMFQTASCELASTSIRVDPAGTVAHADSVALVTAVRGGEHKVDRRDVHFLLHKDGDWKITTIDVAAPKQK